MSDEYNFYIKKKRPEDIFDDVREYYTKDMISWYANSKSIIKTQEKITIRALEVLDLKEKKYLILDAGSGPGFTAMYLNKIGHRTVALDIIPDFLNHYNIRDLNPIAADMLNLPFRPNSFNAIVSISALQWIYREICINKTEKKYKNLSKSLFNILKPYSKAVFQFYPKSKAAMDIIGKIIVENTNFNGNFIIDNPDNPKKRKIFLFLRKDR
ncbi:MAG: class I SAM-dependent methyltransferase [Candidatus Heimdallarchaeota archaeon]